MRVTVVCENRDTFESLRPTDVAIGVSHNDQKDLTRALLLDAGLDGIIVDTAHGLQRLTYNLLERHPVVA